MSDEELRKKADEIALAIERADDHYAWAPIIAEALREARASERERCAKIADGASEQKYFEPYRDGSFGVNGVSRATAREIAAAIRRGTP